MPVQRLSKLPRPRVRLGYDLHRLRACECIEKMFPFLLQVEWLPHKPAHEWCPPSAGRGTAHSAWDATVGCDETSRASCCAAVLAALTPHWPDAAVGATPHAKAHLPVSREAQPTLIHVLLSTHKEAKGICVRSC